MFLARDKTTRIMEKYHPEFINIRKRYHGLIFVLDYENQDLILHILDVSWFNLHTKFVFLSNDCLCFVLYNLKFGKKYVQVGFRKHFNQIKKVAFVLMVMSLDTHQYFSHNILFDIQLRLFKVKKLIQESIIIVEIEFLQLKCLLCQKWVSISN